MPRAKVATTKRAVVKAAKERKTIREPADDRQTFYTNSANIGASLFDFQLAFGEIEEATEELLLVKETARIIMSPSHAKEFVRILADKVLDYEERFGEIPMGPNQS